jgi:hypothetical protein
MELSSIPYFSSSYQIFTIILRVNEIKVNIEYTQTSIVCRNTHPVSLLNFIVILTKKQSIAIHCDATVNGNLHFEALEQCQGILEFPEICILHAGGTR